MRRICHICWYSTGVFRISKLVFGSIRASPISLPVTSLSHAPAPHPSFLTSSSPRFRHHIGTEKDLSSASIIFVRQHNLKLTECNASKYSVACSKPRPVVCISVCGSHAYLTLCMAFAICGITCSVCRCS